MDVIYRIIQQSAIGPRPEWLQKLVIGLFLAIVLTLLSMLGVLLTLGQHAHFSYGY
ncbi:hypothetical protein OZ410_11430 [Robiginitalea sp. M366]|uniref:hypothetical protein n=1 Tax=Robiginitalea aestuariiviva TaxID=3036903 RepID=UPI00240E51CB|nr:hypothetical protein [Robiginitalea aestuariiviva]MDG1572929.1 hypothetical protein [Robiginitalea aestuariiviva]